MIDDVWICDMIDVFIYFQPRTSTDLEATGLAWH
jgi:hypothetical protein